MYVSCGVFTVVSLWTAPLSWEEANENAKVCVCCLSHESVWDFVCLSGRLSQQAGEREASSLDGQISCRNLTLKLLSAVCAYSVLTQELNVAQRQSRFFDDWSPSVDWQGEKQSKVPTAKALQTERRLGAGASCVRANREWHVWFALILFLSPIIICTGSTLNEHQSFSSL